MIPIHSNSSCSAMSDGGFACRSAAWDVGTWSHVPLLPDYAYEHLYNEAANAPSYINGIMTDSYHQ